jgi:hypothetical protein
MSNTLVLFCLLSIIAMAVHRGLKIWCAGYEAETDRLVLAVENLQNHRKFMKTFLAQRSVPPALERSALLVSASIGNTVLTQALIDLLYGDDVSTGYEFQRKKRFNAALSKLQKADPRALDLFHKSLASGTSAMILLDPEASHRLNELTYGLVVRGEEAALTATSGAHRPPP